MQASTRTPRAATRRRLRCAALGHARALKHGRARDAARLPRERNTCQEHLPERRERPQGTQTYTPKRKFKFWPAFRPSKRRTTKASPDGRGYAVSLALASGAPLCARAGWPKLRFTSLFARSAKRKILVFVVLFSRVARSGNFSCVLTCFGNVFARNIIQQYMHACAMEWPLPRAAAPESARCRGRPLPRAPAPEGGRSRERLLPRALAPEGGRSRGRALPRARPQGAQTQASKSNQKLATTPSAPEGFRPEGVCSRGLPLPREPLPRSAAPESVPTGSANTYPKMQIQFLTSISSLKTQNRGHQPGRQRQRARFL